jgi:hypothetical protein
VCDFGAARYSLTIFEIERVEIERRAPDRIRHCRRQRHF